MEEYNEKIETPQKEVYKPKKNQGLWKGFIAGIFSTLVVVLAVVLTVGYLEGYGLSVSNETEEASASAVEVVNDSDVQKKLLKIARIIDQNYYDGLDGKELETYLYKGLVAGLGDPYSAYYSEEELQTVVDTMNGSYYGVGITMSLDTATGLVKVIKVSDGSPAEEADVKVGDFIYMVNGEEIAGKDLSEIASKVRGEEGTKVKITLLREGESAEIEKEIERRNIESVLVSGEMLEGNIGYIAISEFEKVTTSQFENIYNQLLKEGMKGLIVDLRNNPGGQIDVVNEIGEWFLPKGIMTYIEDKYGNRENYSCTGKNVFGKPLVVLLNENSASASEIFAGAVKDYKVGTLVGNTTYGKGIVQFTKSLGDGTALKMTFAKYYTPNGNNIHKTGIRPDVEVELDEMDDSTENSMDSDNQLQEAVKCLKEKMQAQ